MTYTFLRAVKEISEQGYLSEEENKRLSRIKESKK